MRSTSRRFASDQSVLWRCLTVSTRKFFPPTSDDMAEAAEDNEELESKDGEIPELPDVPTKEPTEDGQPEAKKARLDDGADTQKQDA